MTRILETDRYRGRELDREPHLKDLSALRPEGFSLERGTRFAILGAGRVAVSLGFLLKRAGHRIVGCSSRSSAALERAAEYLECPCSTDYVESVVGADAILIAVPDDVVYTVAESLATLENLDAAVAIHTAGSIGIQPLSPLQERGLGCAAIHPLQSIPDVGTGIERIPGSWFGVTCEPTMKSWSEAFVAGLEGRVQWVSEGERPMYHAAAVMASNYLVALAAVIEEFRGDFGPYLPLMKATVANVEVLGTSMALTGPVVRGDEGTVKRHLDALASNPQLSNLYRVLAGATLRSAERAGTIDAAGAARVKKTLEEE